MKRQKLQDLTRSLIIVLAALFVALILILVLADNYNTPTADDIFELFGISSRRNPDDYIRFIDVGQGDSILIASNGFYALIDTGPPESEEKLLSELKSAGIDCVDVLLLTHFHDDHIANTASVLREYPVAKLISPKMELRDNNTDSIRAVAAKIKENGGSVYEAVEGMNFNIGDIEVTIISDYQKQQGNENCLVVMARFFEYEFLFTADMPEEAEYRLLNSAINFDCDVLKVAHHGSNGSTTMDFLKLATPKFAVISVGENNAYNHPSPATLTRLNSAKSEIIRTDQSGTITFTLNADKLTYFTEKTYKK